jgi:hypothetical protein
MRVIVCGSRSWTDAISLGIALDALRTEQRLMGRDITEVVHGDCRGPDRWSGAWAVRNNIYTVAMPADWGNQGRSAGHLRNEKMAQRGADLCVAFWDGESRGTLDMITRATRYGIPVRVVPDALRSLAGGKSR